MKIQNDLIQALQQQGEAHRKPKVGEIGSDAFEELMAGQLRQAQAGAGQTMPVQGMDSAASLAMLMQSAGLSGVSDVNGAQETDEDLAVMEDALAVERIEGLLGQWDQYAAAIGGGAGGNLRSAYGLLSNLSGGVAELKNSMPGLLAGNPELASLVNELDVMTTTETIKFNRGDYL
ncbi:MAG: hypothetical protein LBV80_06730 [Deltaproteobacteria bacterium]|jgi:hypothetical protein|nr:hypothetical protein [Deltaproteobacteria bacterium]